MSTDTPKDSAADPQPQPKKASTRTGRISGGLALIIASIALIGSGYLWYTLLYERQELLAIDVPGTLETLTRETKQLHDGLTDVEEQQTSLLETQETLKSAVDKVQNDLGRHRTDWILAETEQLLLIANRRLQLARDAASALAALRAADRNLELLANPNLIAVRRQVAREIALLESLEKSDVAGASLRLGALADGLDRLPLSGELHSQVLAHAEAAEPAADGGWQTARGMWRDILQLVRIRRHDATERPLLPPEQQYFVRENLRLMLYGAQQALLQGHVQTYQHNLKTASRWLNDHFDDNTPAVQTARAELDKLRATPVMSELPDISGSLEILRKAGRRAP